MKRIICLRKNSVSTTRAFRKVQSPILKHLLINVMDKTIIAIRYQISNFAPSQPQKQQLLNFIRLGCLLSQYTPDSLIHSKPTYSILHHSDRTTPSKIEAIQRLFFKQLPNDLNNLTTCTRPSVLSYKSVREDTYKTITVERYTVIRMEKWDSDWKYSTIISWKNSFG